MAIQISGQSAKTGAPAQAFPQDQQNALLATELNPRYYQNVYQGNVFSASWTGAALAAATASTVGSFGLVNNLGSGKNLVLLDASVGVTAAATSAATGTAFALATVPGTQAVTGQTPGNTPVCLLVGSTNLSVAKPVTVGTVVGTPVPFRNLGWVSNNSVTTQTFFMLGGIMKDEIAGTVVIAPGGFVNLIGVGGTPANFSVTLTMTWVELPI
jgi:hypothetical protein